MEEAEQDGAGGVGAEDAGTEGERGEAVAAEKVDFVGNPAAFGTDGKESAIGRHKGGERGGSGGVGMRNPPGGVRRKRGKNILDQRAEPAVDGHFGEEGVAGLAQTFKETCADVFIPHFAHKVSSVMQIKSQASGAFDQECEVVWDTANDRWMLVPFDGGQMSLTEEIERREHTPYEYDEEDYDRCL